MKRSRDWNEDLAAELKDFDFARDFLLAALQEGLPLQKALGKVVRAYGVTEFSDIVGISPPNIVRALDTTSNPTQQTLNRLLEPFGLEVTAGPMRSDAA